MVQRKRESDRVGRGREASGLGDPGGVGAAPQGVILSYRTRELMGDPVCACVCVCPRC